MCASLLDDGMFDADDDGGESSEADMASFAINGD